MTGVAVSREWSNYLKTPWVNNVKSDSVFPESVNGCRIRFWCTKG